MKLIRDWKASKVETREALARVDAALELLREPMTYVRADRLCRFEEALRKIRECPESPVAEFRMRAIAAGALNYEYDVATGVRTPEWS